MKHCLFLLLLALPMLSEAKTLADTADRNSAELLASRPDPFFNHVYHPLSLQIEAGTQGLGLDVRYGLLSRLSIRTGLSFIPVKENNVLSLPGFQSTNSASINFYNAHLLADFVPFKKMRGFRLVGGAAYLYKAEGRVSVIPTGSYNYGSMNVTGADIGNLDLNVSWSGIAPYAGIGLFKSFPNQVFNFNLDLGTYYMNQPKTHVVGTGLLSDNYLLEPQFNQNLKDYRWLPVLQLNFNFKLK